MLLRRPWHMILLYLKRGVVNLCVLILISVKIVIQNYQCKIMSFHAQIKVLVFSGCEIQRRVCGTARFHSWYRVDYHQETTGVWRITTIDYLHIFYVLRELFPLSMKEEFEDTKEVIRIRQIEGQTTQWSQRNLVSTLCDAISHERRHTCCVCGTNQINEQQFGMSDRSWPVARQTVPIMPVITSFFSFDW